MKKLFSVVIAIALTCALAACAGSSKPQPEPTPQRTSFEIKINPAEHGKIVLDEASADFIVEKGGNITVTLVPDEGYEPGGAEYTDAMGKHVIKKEKLTSGAFEIKNVTADVTISATFTEKAETPEPETYYSVKTAVEGGGGTLTASPESVKSGEKVTFTVAAYRDYRLDFVRIAKSDGSDPKFLDLSQVSKDGTFTLVPEFDMLVTAGFEAVEAYSVTASYGEGGTVTASAAEVEPFGEVTFTITTEEFYKLGSFTVNGIDYTAAAKTGSVTVYDIHEDIEAVCEFVPVDHTITVIATAHGTTTAPETAPHGSVAYVLCVPDDGYVLFSVTVNDEPYTGELPADGRVPVTINGDTTVSAEYREKKEAVGVAGTLSVVGGGKPSGVTLIISSADGAEKARLTTDENGGFSTTLPSGSYKINIDALALRMSERAFLLSYDDVTLDLTAVALSLATDGFTEGYDGGATLESNGAATAFSRHKSEKAVCEAVIQSGEAGVIMKSGGKTLKIAFTSGEVTAALDGKVVFTTDKVKLGGTGRIRVVKYGSTVYVYAYRGSGYDSAAFTAGDFTGACEYGFYSDGAARLTEVSAREDAAEADRLVVKSVKVTRTGSGGVALGGADNGRARLGDVLTLVVTPDYGYEIDEVTACGNALTPISTTETTAIYRFEVASDDTNVIAVHFVPKSGESDEFPVVTVSDGTQPSGGITYDTTLFYRNDLEIDGADPGVIYVSEEEDAVYGGWFYMAVTGGGGNSAFPLYRSRDLSRWERAGKASDGNALAITSSAWSMNNYWAPELIRDPKTGKYFIFFSAGSKQGNANTEYVACDTNTNGNGKWNRLYIGIGISDSPMGPYSMVTAEKYYGSGKTANLNGETINESTPPINFGKHFKSQLAAMTSKYIDSATGYGIWPAIDVSPFITSSGDMYLYFSQHVSSITDGNRIWGMKMKDMITPDFSTLTLLLMPSEQAKNKQVHQFTGTKGDINYNNWTGTSASGANDGGICEGAFAIEHDGKYYLTYSPFGYGDRRYSVMQTVGDTPLGPFRKLSRDYANPVIGIGTEQPMYDFMSGTGHHSFVKAGDELFAVYHAFYNPVDNYVNGAFAGRAIAVDRVRFTHSDYYNCDVLAGTGGTFSLQPLPAVASGFSNVAAEATITASGMVSGAEYLTDGAFPYQPFEKSREFTAGGDATITLEFPSLKEIRAVMVYNSYTYSKAVKKATIRLTLASGKTVSMEAETDEQNYNAAKSYMRPGGAIIADFTTTKVKKIEITLRTSAKLDQSDDTIAVGEIVVLGKTDAGKAADLPLYDVACGSRPSGAFAIDGKFDEPEYVGKKFYTYNVSGVKVETTAVIASDGLYVAARAYDPDVMWNEKNFFQVNSHFEIHFGAYGGSTRTVYVDLQNHSLFGAPVTASARLEAKGVMTAEAFASWETLGYKTVPANVNVFAAYYRLQLTSEAQDTARNIYQTYIGRVKGTLIKPTTVNLALPSSYGSYNVDGYRAVGAAAVFGEGRYGEVATGNVTYSGSTVTMKSDDESEVWYRAACADNLTLSMTINASGGANKSGFVLSNGTEKKYLPLPSGSGTYTLVKSGSTLAVYSASSVVAAVRDPSFGGACSVGLWSNYSAVTATNAKYVSYSDGNAALKAAPAAASGALPIIAIKGNGDVYSDDLTANGGELKLTAYPASGYTAGAARVNGKAVKAASEITVPVASANTLVEIEFTAIADPVTVSGKLSYAPSGGYAANATMKIVGESTGATYLVRTGIDGEYSAVLSKTESYQVTISALGCQNSRYRIENGEFTSAPYATRYALGGGATLNGASYDVDRTAWDLSGKDDGVYVAKKYKNGFFTDGVGEKAIIKFKVTNKSDISAFASVEELKASSIEYDPAIGIQFADGKVTSFAGFWSTGYRVLLNEGKGWGETGNVISSRVQGTNYDNYTWNAINRTYSYMFIRDNDNVYLFYENADDEYVKIYDSAAAGHTFAAKGRCAYGIGFTSAKTFEMEFKDILVLTDEFAEPQIAAYLN